jgi:hypothetical protein
VLHAAGLQYSQNWPVPNSEAFVLPQMMLSGVVAVYFLEPENEIGMLSVGCCKKTVGLIMTMFGCIILALGH